MQIALREHEMNARDACGNLLALTRRLLSSLTAPALAPFLAEWPTLEGLRGPAPHCAVEPHRALPVLDWLPKVAVDEFSCDAGLVAALCRAAPSLQWRQTYTAIELGEKFLQNYAWTEILGPHGLESRAQVACGFLLLGPDTLYPRHRHEAEEIYVPLSGTAQWQQGDAIWRHRAPGSLIHHCSEEPHAMRTGECPLLALYLWRSADLSQQARLDSPR
jgi:hypothetical protein